MWNPDQRMRLATVIRERWWQGHRPPEKAPSGWSLGRDLNICQQLIEREGADPTDLAGILETYDGPPATLAVFWKRDERGLRKILSELRGQWMKNQALSLTDDAPPTAKRRAETDTRSITDILREMGVAQS